MAPSASRASLPKGKPELSSSSSSAPSLVVPSPPMAGLACSNKTSRQAADPSGHKRRCISTACIACRKRKSKCDGALPSCAACASVYGTECIYDPSSDHRRKGVYRERADNIKARSSTLQIIVEAILNAPEDDVGDVVKRFRASDNLDDFAQHIVDSTSRCGRIVTPDQSDDDDDAAAFASLQGETELARKMGELRLENGSVRFIGGTSHLIYLADSIDESYAESLLRQQPRDPNPVTSWTRVTTDAALVVHLIEVYFNYHYAYFTTLSKKLFWRDFAKGASGVGRDATAHCSPLLVNAMLALGCHFTDVAGAYATLGVSRTKGDHFFEEAERLILANEEFAKPRLATVQALALMSVREAGCARESKGWVYSGMSFRMAQDLGLNLEVSGASSQLMSEEEIDARKITFWGCFFFDKCWSNYLGRLPQLPRSSSNVSKFDVFPDEDAATWSPITDKGHSLSYQQPWRTRAAALLLSSLSEISSDLLIFFYHPNHIGRSRGKTAELKMLGEIHQRLEEWHRQLPKEFEPREGQLPHVTLIHMFYHLQYIHLFRPFLKYSASASPLPPHVSPRRICTTHAGDISKLMRQYKKIYNLRQICNIAVYMTHSACTIHLLNLPDKSARRDITHGVKHLEEMAEDWLCARRTLSILSVLARKWKCELPEEAVSVLKRTDEKYGSFNTSEVPSPESSSRTSPTHSDDDCMVPPWTENSPPGHHPTPVHATPFAPPMAGIENQITVMPSLQAPPQHCHPQLSFDAGRMDFRTDMLNGWARQAPSAPPEPGYDDPSLLPVGSCAMPPHSDGLGSGRQVSPEQGMGFNGQHWILHDSAKWHHNFEGWDVGTASPVFTFGQSHNSNIMQTPQDGNEQPRVHLNSLATMSDKAWLPGLD
ncbi:hypothetical protein XA68_17975 [Ophiocordyceps unilateralis]|uniref:Zn(2)-C6 fungal-type domain-containing protein n=1 Tax=Ophiocordyceps unilateralis TaxID=268505 RepID=A0A2A9PK12_OPHUN|nr:hypothetical protein XA68_17975 [Ophiocordyceps unilateralis]